MLLCDIVSDIYWSASSEYRHYNCFKCNDTISMAKISPSITDDEYEIDQICHIIHNESACDAALGTLHCDTGRFSELPPLHIRFSATNGDQVIDDGRLQLYSARHRMPMPRPSPSPASLYIVKQTVDESNTYFSLDDDADIVSIASISPQFPSLYEAVSKLPPSALQSPPNVSIQCMSRAQRDPRTRPTVSMAQQMLAPRSPPSEASWHLGDKPMVSLQPFVPPPVVIAPFHSRANANPANSFRTYGQYRQYTYGDTPPMTPPSSNVKPKCNDTPPPKVILPPKPRDTLLDSAIKTKIREEMSKFVPVDEPKILSKPEKLLSSDAKLNHYKIPKTPNTIDPVKDVKSNEKSIIQPTGMCIQSNRWIDTFWCHFIFIIATMLSPDAVVIPAKRTLVRTISTCTPKRMCPQRKRSSIG